MMLNEYFLSECTCSVFILVFFCQQFRIFVFLSIEFYRKTLNLLSREDVKKIVLCCTNWSWQMNIELLEITFLFVMYCIVLYARAVSGNIFVRIKLILSIDQISEWTNERTIDQSNILFANVTIHNNICFEVRRERKRDVSLWRNEAPETITFIIFICIP